MAWMLLAQPLVRGYRTCIGWAHADSFLHSVASPFHSFVATVHAWRRGRPRLRAVTVVPLRFGHTYGRSPLTLRAEALRTLVAVCADDLAAVRELTLSNHVYTRCGFDAVGTPLGHELGQSPQQSERAEPRRGETYDSGFAKSIANYINVRTCPEHDAVRQRTPARCESSAEKYVHGWLLQEGVTKE